MHARKNIFPAFIFSILSVLIASCHTVRQSQFTYVPDDKALYDTIVKMDSIFFYYYNTCDANLAKYGDFYSDDIEFYHDKGGLMISKADIIESTRKNVCGKVTRQLVKGSIEVYPIKDFGAVEIGYHRFYNNTEITKDTPHAGRFVIIWQRQESGWKIHRVVSLH